MAYYVLLNFDILDREEFREYERQVAATMPSTVKVLAFDDERLDLEGETKQRLVILEFETRAAAIHWYESPAYQRVSAHRRASTSGWVRGVEQFQRNQQGP